MRAEAGFIPPVTVARPRTIDDETLVDAARKAFLEKGYTVTTAEIAEQAGVSEATLFRRFPTKDALFIAAMELPETPPWVPMVAALATDPRPLRERTEELARTLLAFFREILPRIQALGSAGVDLAAHCRHLPVPPPVAGLRVVTTFFHNEQQRGNLRALDPEFPARMLIGAMHHLAFFEACGFDAHAPMPPDSAIRGIVDALLRGIEVETPE